MAAEFAIPTKKTKLNPFDIDICVFCKGKFTKRNPSVQTIDVDKLESVFGAAKEQNDEIGLLLLENKSKILQKEVSIKYHRVCRSSYVNIIHRKNISLPSISSSTCETATIEKKESFTRSKSAEPFFDWKENCFICSNKCNLKKKYDLLQGWSMVTTSINDNEESIYSKVLNAAEMINDVQMIQRLRGNGPDLVAAEARYHQKKNCISHYIRSATITNEAKISANMKVLYEIKSEFEKPIMIEKQVFRLSTLRDRYRELAKCTDIQNPLNYTSQHLKQQLQLIWPELSFICQRGFSDFVCSHTISISDALAKVSEVSSTLRDIEIEEDCIAEERLEPNEDTIIHMAIGILRRRLSQIEHSKTEYYSSHDMNLQVLKDFVDPLLYKALGWLIDDNLYMNALDINDCVNENSKVLNIACDIISLATSAISPKHLGLSVHLHHQYGSRKLIEDMHKLGYGISYTELRQFLTSVASYISSEQEVTASGSMMPPELIPKHLGGKPVIVACDNSDHNECTPDGKKTTHALTSIIITPKIADKGFPKIPRLANRTFDNAQLPG